MHPHALPLHGGLTGLEKDDHPRYGHYAELICTPADLATIGGGTPAEIVPAQPGRLLVPLAWGAEMRFWTTQYSNFQTIDAYLKRGSGGTILGGDWHTYPPQSPRPVMTVFDGILDVFQFFPVFNIGNPLGIDSLLSDEGGQPLLVALSDVPNDGDSPIRFFVYFASFETPVELPAS